MIDSGDDFKPKIPRPSSAHSNRRYSFSRRSVTAATIDFVFFRDILTHIHVGYRRIHRPYILHLPTLCMMLYRGNFDCYTYPRVPARVFPLFQTRVLYNYIRPRREISSTLTLHLRVNYYNVNSSIGVFAW